MDGFDLRESLQLRTSAKAFMVLAGFLTTLLTIIPRLSATLLRELLSRTPD